MKKLNLNIITLSLIVAVVSSCTSVVTDPQPQTSVSADQAIINKTGARAALYGAYDALQSNASANGFNNYMGLTYLFFPDLQGGNLRWTGSFTDWSQAMNRTILTDNASVSGAWQQIYYAINTTNNLIAKVPLINDASFTDQKSILGEAYFLRAYHYFNLLRYWGGVPIVTDPTLDITPSSYPSRASVSDVYTLVLNDLTQAIANLPAKNANGRASIYAAYALKARVHLYKQEWQNAIDAANMVIANPSFTLMQSFTDLFLKQNTAEAIWEIQFNPTDKGFQAFYLFSSSLGGRNEIRPTTGLQGAYAANDARIIKTTDYNEHLKYYRVSTGDDHTIAFRLAEMYLIRAEAQNELSVLNNDPTLTAAAYADINIIRTRAGIGNASVTLQTDPVGLRNEIFLQRRLELALEGHYFFDLVRTGRASAVLANWNDNQALWPIPFREMQANPNLVQNPGY